MTGHTGLGHNLIPSRFAAALKYHFAQRLIDYLDVVKTPHREAFEQAKLKNDFKHFWHQYDQRRGKSFIQTFPKELTDWYMTI